MADPGTPTLISPSSGATVVGNVIVFEFTVPSDTDNNNLIFQIELDTNSTISTSSGDYKKAESRFAYDTKAYGKWEVKNAGGTYIAIPTGGVTSTYYGNDARVSLRSQDTSIFPDSETTWYWRIGVSDDMGLNPVYNQVIFGQAIFGAT